MNDQWLEKEGKKWVAENIISEEQYRLIVAKYKDNHSQRGIGLIPIFASILIALGILSFIAANWSGITPPFRLILLIAVLCTSYGLGHIFLQKGKEALGHSCIGLGIASFGASLILLGQTYHFVSYDARTFIIWSVPALIYLYFLNGRLLFFLTFAILTGGQIYAQTEFSSYSYVLLILFGLGLGWLALNEKNRLYTRFFAAGFILHLVFLAGTLDENWLWLIVILLGVYSLSEWLDQGLGSSLKFFASAAAFGINLVLYFTLTNTPSDTFDYPEPLWFLLIFILLAAFLIYSRMKKGTLRALLKSGILFIPWFYLSTFTGNLAVGILYLIVAFVFPGLLLSEGYRTEQRYQINWGIILFLLVTFIAYINLAWSFMPKSLFFLIGGILLFALYFFLQKKKKDVLEERGTPHEKK
ncbi:Uncharacterized membrane protein [Fictibacillus enclensis]|uniref:DUF2157 domain-containing protein n=1 Tax=Fictibacillus enclensis TaxID=1017270 RepID=A0A0V8JAS7_9BACL|nr:DUF2157 domain-containing protein [Fictibacillus enclensis]KSU84075.1 hypothetical protein AS030_00430 [Fictibacillus enclensis]SCB72702.1 Uncharacterized membrane protein [Fictibacillus enclensis]